MPGFCAIFADSLDSKNGEALVLTSFAGLHTGTDRADGDLDGPQGTMRYLIAQLLSSLRQTSELPCLSPRHAEGCRDHDLQSFCQVFVGLVRRLPPEMKVLCIIDDISWYDQGQWRGLHTTVNTFEYLAETIDLGSASILKILLTSPGRSTEIDNRTRGAKTRRFWGHVTLAAGHVDAHRGTSSLSRECFPSTSLLRVHLV